MNTLGIGHIEWTNSTTFIIDRDSASNDVGRACISTGILRVYFGGGFSFMIEYTYNIMKLAKDFAIFRTALNTRKSTSEICIRDATSGFEIWFSCAENHVYAHHCSAQLKRIELGANDIKKLIGFINVLCRYTTEL